MAYCTDTRPHPDQWILDALNETDTYSPAVHAADSRYKPQTRYTGSDFREVAANERRLHAGQPTRIDFVQVAGQTVKRIWLAGWMPGDQCERAEPIADGWTLDRACQHLEAVGWTVLRLDAIGWARAFRCGLRPVRTGEYMRRFRDRMTANPPAGVNVAGLDLLYYL